MKSENTENNDADSKDLRDGKVQEDSVLLALVEGTVSAVGDNFFRSLVSNLAVALNVPYAFVTEFADSNTRLRTLAFWGNGEILPNVEYGLEGTPCEDVIRGNLCHHPCNIQELFPLDTGLVNLGVESFLGVPLLDARDEVIGHLAVFDTKPMPEEPRMTSVFRVFAARAASELNRIKAEKTLQESERRLSSILDSAMDAVIAIDDELIVRLFNKAAEKTFRIASETVFGQSFEPFLASRFLSVLSEYVAGHRSNHEGEPCLWLPEGLTAKCADGREFPVEGTVSRIDFDQGNLFTIILRDIKERLSAADKLQKLELENRYLQEEIQSSHNFEEIVGYAPVMEKVFQKIKQVAGTDATVLVVGETGTGKELIARAIHNRSKRRTRPLIKVNCAALSPGLIESEFFGHEKGSFTGALSQRIGRFELADGGTIFLDEIGEISLDVQAKLLRVLQEQEFERVGGARTLKVDVRVIAATNRDLKKMVKEEKFRADLYYRLNVFPISIPPLRERLEDLPLLVRYLVDKHSARIGKAITRIPAETVRRLSAYSWPGNIRELENVVERAVILSTGSELEIEEEIVPTAETKSRQLKTFRALEDVERDHIIFVLEKCNWVIEGAKGAAVILDINPNTLRSRMQKLNIRRPANDHDIS